MTSNITKIASTVASTVGGALGSFSTLWSKLPKKTQIAGIVAVALVLTAVTLHFKHKPAKPAAPPPVVVEQPVTPPPVVVERHPQAPVEVDPAPAPKPKAVGTKHRVKPRHTRVKKPAPKAPKAAAATSAAPATFPHRECDASGWCWTYFG